MTKIERVRAVIAGEQPDRPPVSFWYHFPHEGCCGQGAVDAHLGHLTRFDLDFLKIMNDNGYPAQPAIETAADLRDLPVLTGDEPEFARQLDVIKTLTEQLEGEVLTTTTVFSAWTVLRRVVTPRTDNTHKPPVLGGPVNPVDARLTELLQEDRAAVAMALDAIAASLANFATRCIEAGADGIYMSVRDDWVDTEANGLDTYNEMVRTGDGQVLTAARGAEFNMLHVCGVARDFDAFADYPVQVINWADRAGGPAIDNVIGRIKPAVCAGVDNLSTLPSGTPEDVAAEVRDALSQAGGHPMVISAGCTYDPDLVPPANLDAMVSAIRGGQ